MGVARESCGIESAIRFRQSRRVRGLLPNQTSGGRGDPNETFSFNSRR